ncbi:hypothetical protein EQO05_06205 [Methanosarcina sp. MSH10X1]|nr:hypothetical protein EQO05_06205 [Methanosarcina sp. MSH10X1]
MGKKDKEQVQFRQPIAQNINPSSGLMLFSRISGDNHKAQPLLLLRVYCGTSARTNPCAV